jgi:hypothetical protein
MKHAFYAVIACFLAGCNSSQEPDQKVSVSNATSIPKIGVDESLLPILNVDIKIPEHEPARLDMSAVGEAVQKAHSQISEKTTFINFTVSGSNSAKWMHFTIPAGEYRDAIKRNRPSGYFLLLGREVGFNTIGAENAAQKYCAGASNAFCDQL